MDAISAKIDEFSQFELCPAAAPPDEQPTVFDPSMTQKAIRAILDESLQELSTAYPGRKQIALVQRQDQMRARHVRVGRIPGTALHVFLFLRQPDQERPEDRYEPVPVSLLGQFHKMMKLPHVTASVEERGDDAFALKPTQTAPGFSFPVADARLWLQRYRKTKGQAEKRPSEDQPVRSAAGSATKKTKLARGSAPTAFAKNTQEEYARCKKMAVSLNLKAVADPRTSDLINLADLEDDGNHDSSDFEVIAGTLLGLEAAPLCAEDFSAFSQPPQTNYFLPMAEGLDPARTRDLARTKVQWKESSEWSPSTLISVMARSTPRMRNFDATVRLVLRNSEIAAGLGIGADSVINSSRGIVDDEPDSDELFEHGAVTDEELLLKHSKTLQEMQDAILHLALEPYCAMIFSQK